MFSMIFPTTKMMATDFLDDIYFSGNDKIIITPHNIVTDQFNARVKAREAYGIRQ